MLDEIKESILKKLEKNKGRAITIKQIGFIKSKFCINNLNYEIEFDIIKMSDEKEETYICLNINQIYKCEILGSIKLYLDNDTQLEICEK